MGKTSIPYGGPNGESWSPVTGCSRGCAYCWSRTLAHRFHRSFVPTFHSSRLTDPLRWRKPRRVLVCFNGDLFDRKISNEEIAAIYNVMATTSRHVFLILTKQAARMAEWYEWVAKFRRYARDACRRVPESFGGVPWPLPNAWVGVSCTNQADADARIPGLLRCPAEVHWLSAEPLLGAIDLSRPYRNPGWPCDETLVFGLDWVVTGFQSGVGAPTENLEHARKLRDACAAERVPFMFKDPTGFPYLDGHIHGAMPGDAP